MSQMLQVEFTIIKGETNKQKKTKVEFAYSYSGYMVTIYKLICPTSNKERKSFVQAQDKVGAKPMFEVSLRLGQ